MQEVRLIDANALLEDLKATVKAAREWKEEAQDEEIKIRADQAFGTFIECALRVKNAPTIELVRRGRWVYDHNGIIICTVCHYPRQIGAKDFCGKCGAKMDVGAENG